ncbi:terminase small subunit [Enterocloster clostridioformis]|uniref:terminase small subunit n=3 Tax=Enterocloster clostridioformis TaxID=1531 RepID=UPI00080C5D13|nr:terminase small subunit [Enterocloster clostridioformis]ANU47748.1 terminase small subunit [Lachnoclostridium sp. YL32]NDO30604.1 terminase small subunit [Enterocloster clostridioformis]OXE66065.1 terminase small subunit [Enterocloster clostridioformis]QQR03349.1 terminase small subunit [Enterocloster clostridioformis]
MALTPKQKIFADEYLIDLNATRAYKVAYPKVKKDNVAKAAGSRLLTNVNVATYIDERMKEREKRTEITQDMVLKELAKLGFFDIRKLFDSNGKPVDISMLDDDTAACIAGLEVVDYFEGAGEDREFAGYVKKYKLSDKLKALEMLGRHLGMFKDKLELSGGLDTEKTKLDDLLEQMRGGG